MADLDAGSGEYRRRHVAYFKECLAGMPEPYTGLEASKISAVSVPSL